MNLFRAIACKVASKAGKMAGCLHGVPHVACPNTFPQTQWRSLRSNSTHKLRTGDQFRCSRSRSLHLCCLASSPHMQWRLEQSNSTHKMMTGAQFRSSRARSLRLHCSASEKPDVAANRFVESVKSFVWNQFVPIGLMTGVIAGLFCPEAGAAAAHSGLSKYTTTGIFILSGLSLRRSEGLAALSSFGAFSYGMLAILLVTPMAALLVLALPLQPVALAVGLAVFCAMPTTLSTGIALTQTVGGNAAMALLLTLSSNMLAVLTVPFLLPFLLGPVAGAVQLESLPLLIQLVKTVLLPALFGMACRSLIPGLAGVIDGNRRVVSICSTVLLSTVPWMQISAASMQNVTVSPLALLLVVGTGVGIHVGYLLFNTAMVRLFNLGGSGPGAQGIKRAVILVTSQKTLPVAVAVLAQLSGILGDQIGLAALPCVLCHLGQNLTDSFLVSRWLKSDREKLLKQNTPPKLA